MLSLILAIGLVLLLSAFFSASEAALLSLSAPEIGTLAARQSFGSKSLARIKPRFDRSIFAIVIMNNISNIVGSIVVGQLVIQAYGDAALAVVTTALTFGVIVFSEIIPKSLGVHYSEHVALFTAPFIHLLSLLFLPIIVILEAITQYFKRGERKVGTEEQIRSLVTMGRQAGHIETDEGQLIHRAFILNDKCAKDSMTDLKDIDGLQSDMTLHDAFEEVVGSPHSRFPVFGSSIHEIIGLVLKIDILEAVALDQDETLQQLLRETLVVDASVSADSLLALFRKQNTHLAVVQEEGHTIGIVTLEDVLEELVGNIEDETDSED